jgi:hypothetical protein
LAINDLANEGCLQIVGLASAIVLSVEEITMFTNRLENTLFDGRLFTAILAGK